MGHAVSVAPGNKWDAAQQAAAIGMNVDDALVPPENALRGWQQILLAAVLQQQLIAAILASFSLIVMSELGDKTVPLLMPTLLFQTFFIAAILSMKHSRTKVFIGSLGALAVMTILSVGAGAVLPQLIERTYTGYASTALFFFFGIRLTLDAYQMDWHKTSEELREVELELAKKADSPKFCEVISDSKQQELTSKNLTGSSPTALRSGEHVRGAAGGFTNLPRTVGRTCRRICSPIILQAFTLTFLAEWGDRSQISTIAMAASQSSVGVAIGATLGHTLCTLIAILGGRLLASRISEKTVTLSGEQDQKCSPEMDSTVEPDLKRQKTPSTFLGRPLNKLDIDELEIDKDTVQSGPLGHLAALTLAIPTAQKSLRASDQLARDDQGRRRFHGAFTGGFSAGHFNTVGSVEGWKPSTFESSREGGRKRSRVEDYMDEEDLENFTTRGSAISLVCGPEALQRQDDLDTLLGSNDIGIAADIHAQVSRRAGVKILRSMGWREGNPVLAPVPRRRPKYLGTGVDTQKSRRVLGPQLPTAGGHTAAVSSSDQELIRESSAHEENWLERRRALFQSVMRSARSLRHLKADTCGLGYVPTSLRDMTTGIGTRRRQLTSGAGTLPARKELPADERTNKFRGGGFGIGALEDEDEWDSYAYGEGHTPSRNEKVALIESVESSANREQDLTLKAPLREYVFVDRQLRAGGELDRVLFIHHRLRPPPEMWRPCHVPHPMETAELEAIQNDSCKGVMAMLVEHLKSINALRVQQSPLPATEPPRVPEPVAAPSSSLAPDTEKLRAQSVISSLSSSMKPLWSRVADGKQKELISSLISTSKFVKETETSMTQMSNNNRMSQDEKIPASVALKSAADLTDAAALEERKEFGKHYREFRMQYPSLELIVSPGDLPSLSTTRQLTTKYSRTSHNWKPEKLVCRAFKVVDPWAKMPFVSDAPFAAPRSITEVVQKSASRSKAFVSSLLEILGPSGTHASATVPSPVVKEDVKNEVVAGKEIEEAPETVIRPPQSIFKSVFGDDEDDEEEED